MQKLETTVRALMAKIFFTASLVSLLFLCASLQAAAQTGASGNTQSGKSGAPAHDPAQGTSGTETIKRGTTHTYTGAGRTPQADTVTSPGESKSLPQDTVQRGSSSTGSTGESGNAGTGTGTTGTNSTGKGNRGTGENTTRSGSQSGTGTGSN